MVAFAMDDESDATMAAATSGGMRGGGNRVRVDVVHHASAGRHAHASLIHQPTPRARRTRAGSNEIRVAPVPTRVSPRPAPPLPSHGHSRSSVERRGRRGGERLQFTPPSFLTKQPSPTMALPPGLQALAIGPSNAAATVEFGIDYLCPFSAKLVIGVQHHLLPLIFGSSAPWEGKVRIVLRPYPQPWHASSTLVNEAAIAAAKISRISEPEVIQDPKTNAFWIFSQSLMAKQDAYFDGPSRNRNPDQLRADLANLAVAVLGEAPKKSKSTPIVSLPSGQPLGQTVRNLLKVGEGNEGSKVVPDLKYCVKYGRQNGIHVTPTASE